MRKEITEKCGILREKGVQVESALGRDEAGQRKLAGLNERPLLHCQSVRRVGPGVSDVLENHKSEHTGSIIARQAVWSIIHSFTSTDHWWDPNKGE